MDSDDWHAAHGLAQPSEGIKMKLGEKLAKTLDELEKARIDGIEAKASADMEKIRRERQELADLRDKTIQKFTDSIEAGRVPLVRVTNYNRQEWIRAAQKGKAAHQDVWEEFKTWAKRNALVIIAKEDHDGMGMDSWITLTVEPVRPGTRSANPFPYGLKGDLGVGDYRG